MHIDSKLYVLRIWWTDELSKQPKQDDFVLLTNDDEKAKKWADDIKTDHEMISYTSVKAHLYIAQNFENIDL